MRNLLHLVIFFLLLNCSSSKSGNEKTNTKSTSKVVAKSVDIKSVDTLLIEKITSRAILIDKNFLWYAGGKGMVGKIDLLTKKETKFALEGVTEKTEFRSIAQTAQNVFVLSIESPGLLYRIDKITGKVKKVHHEKDEKTFFDSMQFLNNNEGFAIGDPIGECPLFIKTVNGGSSWSKKTCTNLPKFVEGEAFFATSNTNLILRNKSIFMISGGVKSRVAVSNDKGITWRTYDTPLVQGEKMTGAFCADFYDEFVGVIAGGNYEKPDDDIANKAITFDGGQTWKLLPENQGLGYISCIQFVPQSEGKSLVAVSANGIYLSTNFGKTWSQITNDKDYVTFRFLTPNIIIASGKNKIVKIEYKQ